MNSRETNPMSDPLEPQIPTPEQLAELKAFAKDVRETNHDYINKCLGGEDKAKLVTKYVGLQSSLAVMDRLSKLYPELTSILAQPLTTIKFMLSRSSLELYEMIKKLEENNN